MCSTYFCLRERIYEPGSVTRITFKDSFTFLASHFTCSFTWLLINFVINKPKKFGHPFSVTYCTCTNYESLFQVRVNYPAFLSGRDGYSSGLSFLCVDVPPFALWSECVNWRNITWSIFDKFIGLEPKSPWHVVEIKQEKAVFCQSVGLTVLFCGLYESSTIILVEIFSDMCCLEDNASWNCQTNIVARSV